MTLRIRTITMDCANPYRLAQFWTEVIGYHEDAGNPNLPEDDEALLVAPDGSANMLLMRVPESKEVKNRVHLDLAPVDSRPESRDAEVERVLRLGATIAADRRRPDGTGWVVLTDAEGNEFCIERGVAGG